MWKIKKPYIRKMAFWIAGGILAAAILALIVWGGLPRYHEWRIQSALGSCEPESAADVQNDCIFRIIEKEMRTMGVEAAFEVFSHAYERFPNFANGGCHTRSHRMGDLVYYSMYFGKENLDAIDFPQTTTACGYGFFHGFLEHFTQDHPTPEAVDGICMYLTKRLSGRMGDIESICYHGSGHGFALAETEEMKQSDWGDIHALTDNPARQCANLGEADEGDIEQCYEGIFNIVVDYMSLNEYGFSYNTKAPFLACEEVSQTLKQACIYEMAMKIDSISEYDPRNMVGIVSSIDDEPLRIMAFGVGIAGVIQQVVAKDDGYQKVLEGCLAVPEPYRENCIASIAWGLYEHGDPQKEYKKVLAFCGEESITGDTKTRCYERASERLPRFYSDEKIKEICREFPSEYRNSCLRTADLRAQPVSASS